MRITLIPLIFLLTAIFFLSSCNSVLAKENDIGQSQIHPAHPLYFLKTVRENIENAIALTPRVKLIRQLEFATRRLREVKALVSNNRQDLIEPTLERYWFHISKLPDKDIRDEELSLRIKESLVVHLQTLDRLYPQLSSTGAKMAVRSTLNRLMGRLDIPNFARLPVCDFLAREASSSALNQSEQVILAIRSKNCLKVKAI